MLALLKKMYARVVAFWHAVEAKVKAAGLMALAASMLAAMFNALNAGSSLLAPLPPHLQFVVIAVAPTIATFLAGWAAKHTPREDV